MGAPKWGLGAKPRLKQAGDTDVRHFESEDNRWKNVGNEKWQELEQADREWRKNR